MLSSRNRRGTPFLRNINVAQANRLMTIVRTDLLSSTSSATLLPSPSYSPTFSPPLSASQVTTTSQLSDPASTTPLFSPPVMLVATQAYLLGQVAAEEPLSDPESTTPLSSPPGVSTVFQAVGTELLPDPASTTPPSLPIFSPSYSPTSSYSTTWSPIPEEEPPLTPFSKLITAMKEHPPYHALFHLHFLCACRKHLTPGPKTSIQMTGSHTRDNVTDILMERFNIEYGQTLIYGDRTTGAIEPDYDGLKGRKNGPVKVILHDSNKEILVLEKSVSKKGQPIKIWEDAEEHREYKCLMDGVEIPNVCPCDDCINQKNEELAADASERRRTQLILDNSDISPEDRGHVDSRSRSSSLQETERMNSSSPEHTVNGFAEREQDQDMENMNWELDSVFVEDSDADDGNDERVWTNPARHPQPVSTPFNTTPPAKISRMPSDEEWERAAKRMRIMR